MPFPTTVDAIVDGPPASPSTAIHVSQVLGPQRALVGPTWLNVKSDLYAGGAKGDDATDDAPAFNALIAAAPSGSTIYVPPGTYRLGSQIAVTNKSLRFVGAGKDATILKANAASANILLTGVTAATFADMTFDGGVLGGANSLLGFINSSNIRVRDCRLQNIVSPAGQTIFIQNVQRAWIQNNEFSNTVFSGVFLQDPGTGNFNDEIWITDNHMLNCGQTLVAGNAPIQSFPIARTPPAHRYCHIERNFVKGSLDVGIGATFDFSWIIGNRVENGPGGTTTGECIALQGSNTKVLFNQCFQKSTTPASCILQWNVAGASGDHNEIAHNLCTGVLSGPAIATYWSANGITIDGTYIHDNECFGNTQAIVAGPVAGVTTGTWNNAVVANNKLYGNTNVPIVQWNSPITAPAFTGGNSPGYQQHVRQTPTFAASFTPELMAGSYISVILTANITVNAPVAPSAGTVLTFVWRQDATGTRTITYGAGYGVPASWPAVNTGANLATTDRFIFDGTNWVGLSRSTG